VNGTGRAVYSISAVSRMIGVPVATIRTWEDRYGLVIPDRSASGHRLYRRDQVGQLRFVRTCMAEGASAADAHRLLAEQADAGPPAAAQAGAPSFGLFMTGGVGRAISLDPQVTAVYPYLADSYPSRSRARVFAVYAFVSLKRAAAGENLKHTVISHRKLLEELLSRDEKRITAAVNEHISSTTLPDTVAD